jgi:hypothetical protein
MEHEVHLYRVPGSVVSETPTVLARVLLRVCAYSPGLFLQEPVAVTAHCIQKQIIGR